MLKVIALLEGINLKSNEESFMEFPVIFDDMDDIWKQETKDVNNLLELANDFFNNDESLYYFYDCYGLLNEYGEIIWEDGSITEAHEKINT